MCVRRSMLNGGAPVLDIDRAAVAGPGRAGGAARGDRRWPAGPSAQPPLGGDPAAVGDRFRVRRACCRTRERPGPHLPGARSRCRCSRCSRSAGCCGMRMRRTGAARYGRCWWRRCSRWRGPIAAAWRGRERRWRSRGSAAWRSGCCSRPSRPRAGWRWESWRWRSPTPRWWSPICCRGPTTRSTPHVQWQACRSYRARCSARR